MNKNFVLFGVVIIIVLGLVFSFTKGKSLRSADTVNLPVPSATPIPMAKPRPKTPVAGDVFADSAVKDLAFQVFPGKLSEAALAASKGWTFKSTTQKNGTTLVDFIPSEQVDNKTSYTVKKGEVLYYVEVNPGDDADTSDKFLLDDYGVIVGPEGLVR